MMETTNHNYCIILAGGVGRRLWPASQKELPKQFIDFFGTGRTLLQQTFDRFSRFIPKEHIYVSTYEGYVDLVSQQLPQLPTNQILPEPVQLNTAPAAIWGTWHAALSDSEANVVVSPADQLIQHEDRFEKQILQGLEYVASHPQFLAIGVRPTQPNTAYGYIQMGDETDAQKGLSRVQSFSEKPELNYAKMFLDSGEFLWNTGVFLWKADTMGRQLAQMQHRPDYPVEKLAKQMVTIAAEMNYIRTIIPEGLPRSIDLLVLEHCSNVMVQQCDFGWADIGCWTELHEASHLDADHNAVTPGAHVMLQGTQNCMISLPHGHKAVIAGLDGYVVAEQNGILMICPNKDPDAIRRLINEGLFF